MLSSTLADLQNKKFILPSTKLEQTLDNHMKNLNIFRDLKENEKLGKQQVSDNSYQYYKVVEYRMMWLSRWYYGEGRYKTIEYLDSDFSDFMAFLDELLKNLEIDPYCYYVKLAKKTKQFIDDILPGLYSLKKTYPTCKEMVAKVDSIILTLIDFKDRSEDLIKEKEKSGPNHINFIVRPLHREV